MSDNDYEFARSSYNFSEIIGGNFADSILNCYLFEVSVKEVITFRLSSFVDNTDIVTSFLFNMLAQSVQLKNLATTLSAA